MKLHTLGAAVLLSLLLLAALLTPGATPRLAAQGPSVSGPIVGPRVTPKSFNGNLRTLAQISAPTANPRARLRLLPHEAGPAAQASDPVVQTKMGNSEMPSPNTTFAGLDFANWGAGWPPDTNADVGPNDIIETVNTSIGIYNKSGTRLFASTFDDFWSAVITGTPCNGENYGDPVALYDALSDRWLISDFAFSVDFFGNPQPPYYECVAVSKTGDPVGGGWWFYPILADNSEFSDYPKFGLWPDAYYMTANMFNGNSYAGARAWAFDRNKMINGQSFTPVYFNTSDSYGSLLPSNLRGAQPPGGSPNYVAAIDAPSSDTIHVWKFHFDPVTPGNSTFTGPTDISVASFTEPCQAASIAACIPQQGSSEKVDSLGDRLMMQLQYRNLNGTESLWAAHTVADSANQGSQTGIRWYQLDVTGGTIATTPVQQSTYKPTDGIFRWMPSLAVNKFGDMAVGYSASSSTMYPAIRYAGRLAGDAPNQLSQGEATLVAGTGSQSGGFNRWGDYSAMTVDPGDDCTFWYTNEYYTSTGQNWQTRIGSFSFNDCRRTEDTDSSVQYNGWQGVEDSNAKGGSYRVSDTQNDKIKLTFTGTKLKWFYITGPDEGIANVKLDGASQPPVDLYSATVQYGVKKVYSNLTDTSHTILIQVSGTHSGGSTGNKVVLDKFAANGQPYQDTDINVKYNAWVGLSDSNASGGSYRRSKALGAEITFPFTGTTVKWIALKGPNYGMAEVYIDGVDQGTVDLYSSALQYQAKIKYSGLAAGSHTLKIDVLHTKNAASSGYQVGVDAFDVTP
jgi:hypothetical protein